MKPFILLFAVLFSLTVPVTSSLAQAPAGFKPGYIITQDNNRQEGFIKENFGSKGILQFQAAGGKKITYSASDIKETGIESNVYISQLGDFFKVVSTGTKASLFQKVSSSKGQVIYNGSEAVGVGGGTEGSINDYFLKTGKDNSLHLLTRKNFQQVLTTYCIDCPVFVENIRSNKQDFTEIEKVIQRYNECQ